MRLATSLGSTYYASGPHPYGLADMDSDGLYRPVVATETVYPDGHIVAPHHHRRSQLLYGSTGVVVVTTADIAWAMPPRRAMWIPAGTVHEVRMLGGVRKLNLYIEPDAIDHMPDRCRVLGVPKLMRSLLDEAVTLPAEYHPDGRTAALMTLILHELPRLPALPLSLPLPRDEAMAHRCRAFLLRPTAHDTIDRWTKSLGVSRRTFTRWFRQQTGLSFAAWRQQACIMAALPRLAAEHPVTTIALDLGYDNPAAFTTMFKRVMGSAPTTYIRDINPKV